MVRFFAVLLSEMAESRNLRSFFKSESEKSESLTFREETGSRYPVQLNFVLCSFTHAKEHVRM